jgi:Amt family ammonium transporter
VVGVFAFAVSYVLAKLIDRFMGFRVSADDETTGVDFTQHAESAYAEGVHGHQPLRRPTSVGDLLAPGRRPETAEEG